MRAQAYPHPTGSIQLIQTHISFVLLAGDHVYKIKKPVNFGFLNFSTLSRRLYYCRKEVQLNSRLCSDTYLGVVPIRGSASGHVVNGPGETVEYAVHMRRLPADRMMDHLLDRDEVTPAMLESVARKLAAFHDTAETSPRIAKYGDWAIRYNQRENEDQWSPYIGRTITPEQDRILRAYTEAFFARKADVLQRRVQEQRIRRVHADLRSDAVCFVNGICIFDCVEFSSRINLLDVARDTGFLEMDLEYRGRPDLAKAFIDHYVQVARDPEHREVLDFYAMYSACVRGKVESFLLDQPEVPDQLKKAAAKAAKRYFDLACRYAASLPPAVMAITCGLPGTGKSSLAAELASTGFEVLSSDIVRKELTGVGPSEHRYEDYRAGIYSTDFTARTYTALLDRARTRLEAGQSVVLDASFLRRADRRAARRLARDAGAQFACLYLQLDDDTARRRIKHRAKTGDSPSDALWHIYTAQKRRFQKPTEIPPERLIKLDASSTIATQAKAAQAALHVISPLSVTI
jgi:aminoglycoside phosphotransferase family enzyme/predicted kinase